MHPSIHPAIHSFVRKPLDDGGDDDDDDDDDETNMWISFYRLNHATTPHLAMPHTLSSTPPLVSDLRARTALREIPRQFVQAQRRQ